MRMSDKKVRLDIRPEVVVSEKKNTPVNFESEKNSLLNIKVTIYDPDGKQIIFQDRCDSGSNKTTKTMVATWIW